ncbi:MAG: phenylalanine--tRNA ligase subunit beta [Chloroflexota bacterium]|nr:phenylalanine--tRNA ligase subunit beta [Chloroflexota bacterium]
MRVSLRWLEDYVAVKLPVAELAHRLTMAGIEVAQVIQIGDFWQNTFVGTVADLQRHPNADRLQLVTVDYGQSEQPTFVTGAMNIAVGDKVPVALLGAELNDAYSDTPQRIKLKPVVLRGVKSEGMVCSARELGLGDDHEGILILDADAPVGTPLQEYMGDTILELDLKPNRSDCLAMINVAREVAALTGERLRQPATQRIDTPALPVVRVDIKEPKLCARYAAGVVTEVTIGPSPRWMQERLEAAGMRPINNIVDVTNYVMLEYGQPLHAFDYDKVEEGQIIVRRAHLGEKLTTLDGEERTLEAGMLVIADPKGAIALAGVMGGLDTEVTERTTSILLEAASFHPTSIRRTRQALALPSEASRRFEQGVPPELVPIARDRAIELIAKLADGRARSHAADSYVRPQQRPEIELSEADLSRLLGMEIPMTQAAECLRPLGFTYRGQGGRLHVTVPLHRLDVTCAADLVEEVARMVGYDNIPTTLPAGPLPEAAPDPLRTWTDRAKQAMVGAGFAEAITYTLTNASRMARLLPKGVAAELEDDQARAVADAVLPLHVSPLDLKNPFTSEASTLRTVTLAGLLETLANNLRRRTSDVHLFEIAPVFLPVCAKLPEERRILTAVMGEFRTEQWGARAENSFYTIKGVAEQVLRQFGIAAYGFVPVEHPTFHPYRAAAVTVRAGEEERVVGIVGEINAEVSAGYDIDQRVMALVLNLHDLVDQARATPEFAPPSRHPAVVQDLAIVLDAQIPAERVVAEVRNAGGKLLEGVDLFDVYQGPQVPEGKRSLAYTLTFRAPDRTLNDAEVNTIRDRIIFKLQVSLDATLR